MGLLKLKQLLTISLVVFTELLVCHAIADEQNNGAKRIISLSPAITETIYAIGAGDRIAGVCDFCFFPAESLTKPKVGGFAANTNIERIISLKPDLIIVQGNNKRVEKYCLMKGIRLYKAPMDSVTGVYDDIKEIGRLSGYYEQAITLCDKIRFELSAIEAEAAIRPRTKVFLCIGRMTGSMTSLSTVGGNSFISELLKIAGGDNVFSFINHRYPEMSKESLIARAPDVIIDAMPGYEISKEEKRMLAKQWDKFPNIPAVRNGKVYIATDYHILLPGPRIADTARSFAKILQGNEYE